MAKQIINLGSAANDGTGDKLRVAFDKVNDNFTELYDMGGGVGAQGEQGATGAKGEVGAQGVAGTTGAQGVQGAVGTKGDKGNTGAQGSSGASSDRITNGGYNLIVQPQGHVTVPTSAYATAQLFSASGVDFYLGTLDAGNYWEFKADGTLKLPGIGAIVDANNNSVLGGGGGSTANVTFQDNIVIGTGVGQSDGLYLAAGAGQVGNLQYLRLRGGDDDAHIHFDTANVEAYDLYIGDDNKFVKLERGYNGNVVIGTSSFSGITWKFDTDGKIQFPLLYSDRGDNPSGTVYGNTLKFANSSYQAIIAGPEGTDTNQSAERMVIEGGKGYTGTSGEGGDIYIWAGRGGDAGGTGGDIKIRGGYGYSEGGYIRIDGGETAAGPGGYVEITGGSSAADHGGDIRLISGYGATAYGNVSITSASKNWRFNNDGNTIFPNTAQQTIHLGTRSFIKYLDDQIIQQSGNAAPDTFYTITNQEDSFWETYTQTDVTGGNSAWSWIQSETADANNPYVLIETKKLNESPKTWVFDANGTLTLPDNSGAGWPINQQRFGMGNVAAWLDGQWTIGEFSGSGVSGTIGIRIDPAIEGNTGMSFPGAADSITQPVQIYSTGGGGISLTTGSYNWEFNADGTVRLPVKTYSGLPSPTTSGLRSFINDSSLDATHWGSVTSGGGANTVPVFSDGSNWRIG